MRYPTLVAPLLDKQHSLGTFRSLCCLRLHLPTIALDTTVHLHALLPLMLFVQQYLTSEPDSLLAANLRACNHFRLSSGAAAEADLMAFKNSNSNAAAAGGAGFLDSDLVRHNLVVFRGGKGVRVAQRKLDISARALPRR